MCLKGYYAPGSATTCTPCTHDNQYTSEDAQAKCKICGTAEDGTVGHFTDGGTSSTRTTCKPCTAGFWCNGFAKQNECQGGTFSEAVATACESCAAGKFQPDPKQTKCDDCVDGQYQADTQQLACIKCDAGKFRTGPQGSDSASKKENVACEECEHGKYQADAGKLECSACDAGSFPDSSKTACSAQNTEEHVCHEKRNCVALPDFQFKPVPTPCNKLANPACEATYFWPHNAINNYDDWCDYQCAAAPDRGQKSFCTTQCKCHEKRSVTEPETTDTMIDKQCNDHATCSHVTCKLEAHRCPAHTKYKKWAEALGFTVGSQAGKVSIGHGEKETFSSNCDDNGEHFSIRVSHHGRRETTCRHGHFCYVEPKTNQCKCVQRDATRPDEDRCWYDVRTETSDMACYRLCKKTEADAFATLMAAGEKKREADAAAAAERTKQCCTPVQGTDFVPLGCAECREDEESLKAAAAKQAEEEARAQALLDRDNKACTASEHFKDIKPPTLKLCQPTALTVDTASEEFKTWDLCEASAMDQMDGDVTSSIRYTVVRLAGGGEPEYLARDAPFKVAKARFRGNGIQGVPGALINGNYLVSMKVKDAAGNENESDEEITITKLANGRFVASGGTKIDIQD
jgi:hypothetical protein